MVARSAMPGNRSVRNVRFQNFVHRQESGYSKRSLKDKPDPKAGAATAILEAPEGFAELIDIRDFDTALDLDAYDYLHFFTASTLDSKRFSRFLQSGSIKEWILWISWPKKASGMQTDLGENAVRALGLVTGLVDVKVCAIDHIWSGLKFMHRRASRTI